MDKIVNKKELIPCPECSIYVKKDRIDRHIKKVHGIVSDITNETETDSITMITSNKKLFMNKLIRELYEKNNKPMYPYNEKTYQIIASPSKSPKPPHQVKKPKNVSKIKRALLAPVPDFFLEKAVRDIYPVHGKVSFGSDMSKTEMLGIQKYAEHHHEINVYLFYKNYVRYRSILINEFYIYANYTSHPKPWGSWNEIFKSYYTVIDIIKFEMPVADFTHASTENKIVFCPRPSWIIDV